MHTRLSLHTWPFLFCFGSENDYGTIFYRQKKSQGVKKNFYRAIKATKFFLSPKKSRSDFFWRRPLGFFDPTGRPRRQKKNYRQKKSRSDFFWRRPLGCVLKETYAEGGKKRLVTCVDKETYAEGGKKRLVTCVDKERFFIEKVVL